ncbi:MAG: hypothetical protein ACK48S_04760 [Planctomycetia bacterium]|jgi:hypothetical protein
MATATSKKRLKRSGSKGRKASEMTSQRFLVVADIGPDADYTTEPRHLVEVVVDRDVDYRKSPKQRRLLEQRLRCRISSLPSKDTPLLIWVLDSQDRPVRLLNGSEAVSEKLLPMVSCEQKMHTATILMELYGEVSVDVDSEEEDPSDVEYEVLTEYFNDLFYTNVSSSDFDYDMLTVVAYGWKEVEIELPFECSADLTPTQIQYALDVAHDEASLGCFWETYTDIGIEPCAQAWFTQKGKPVLCLHSLRDLQSGEMSRQKFRAICQKPEKHIPMEVLKAR